jgi:hypothetical protein
MGMNEKHRLLIEALAGTPRDLVRLTRRLSDAQVLARPAPDGWCVKDVVAHLLDIERWNRISRASRHWDPIPTRMILADRYSS